MSKTKNKSDYFENSEFVKTIGVTQDHFDYIVANRGKKSRAGFLKSIIEFYIERKDQPKLL